MTVNFRHPDGTYIPHARELRPAIRTGFRAALDGPWLYSQSPWNVAQTVTELLGWAATVEGATSAHVEETFEAFPYRTTYQCWVKLTDGTWRRVVDSYGRMRA